MSDLDTALWRRARIVFTSAIDVPPQERSAFVRRACGGDSRLLEAVGSLLAQDAQLTDFLDRPVVLPAGLPASLPGDPWIGEKLGPYRLLRRIGEGGTSTVYRAAPDGDAPERAAVKILRRELLNPAMVRRFRREREILSRLQHPNIARVFYGGTTPSGEPFVATELIDGTPITEFCDGRRLPIRRRIELFRDVCAAVEYAHRNLVIHRDLKPSNVLVNGDGHVKLLDFGISKLLGQDGPGVEPTATRERLLTPRYASPEQLAGRTVTASSDVYSLGVILYELLCGRDPAPWRWESRAGRQGIMAHRPPLPPSGASRRPASEGSPGPTLETIAENRSTDPDRLRRTLAGDLDNIALRALQTEPGRRFRSPEALSEDLRRFLEGLPVWARPATLPYRFSKLVGRNKVAVAATVVALAAVAGLTFRSQDPEEGRRRAAPPPGSDALAEAELRTEAERERARDLLEEGVHPYFADRPDQPLLAAISRSRWTIVLDLLEAGDDPNQMASSGHESTPLMLAARHAPGEVITELIERGAQVNARSPETGQTALMIAASSNNTAAAEALLAGGADIDTVDQAGLKAVNHGARAGRGSAVVKLIQEWRRKRVREWRGPEVDRPNEDGNTLLSQAAQRGDSEEVERLLELGADPTRSDADGRTPLIRAVDTGDPQLLDRLLRGGAEVDAQDQDGRSALHYVARRPPPRVARTEDSAGSLIETLMRHGATVGQTDDDGYTSLHLAAREGQIPALRALLEAGADPDAVMWRTWTPLVAAASRRQVEAVKILLPVTADRRRVAGIALLASLGRQWPSPPIEVVEILLEAGSDLGAENSTTKRTPLVKAAQQGWTPIVERILEAGAGEIDLEHRCSVRRTALFYAAEHEDRPAMVEALLRAGAEVNVSDRYGNTPLLLAVRDSGSRETIRLLLQAGADPLRGRRGKRPLDLARASGDRQLVELIAGFGDG